MLSRLHFQGARMDHKQALEEYVLTHEAISNLFESKQTVSLEEFKALDKVHVIATREYINSLKSQLRSLSLHVHQERHRA